ncbi:MAG: ABC transporter permease [Lachnospira sp.]|nr:ABC transporter permease [Lachnospira sp.]
MLRKLFRYKLTSIFFVICQLIVYFAVFGALGIYNKAFDKEKDRLEAIYDRRIEMEVMTMVDIDVLTYSGLNLEAGNLLLAGKLSLALQEGGSNTRSEVILKQNEEMPYKLLEGRLPGSEPEDAGKRLVALGRDKYKYAYEENGKKYVTIESETYEVVGVIGSERSDYWDYKVVLNINCIGENTLKNIVKKNEFTIELGSNEGDLNDAYSRVYGNIMSADSSSIITAKKINNTGESTVEKTLGKENLKVNIIVYIFCLFNCMVMSEFWIIQRKKDLAIKKAFGMSDYKIIVEIAGNILALSLVALVGFFVIYGVFVILPVDLGIKVTFNLFTCVSTVAAVLVTVIITMIYPIYKVLRFQPVNVIGSGE